MQMLALLLAFVLPVSSAAPTGRGATPRDVVQAPGVRGDSARARLITGLSRLASWANDNELFARRDGVWRTILALDPENADARKGLRYSRDGAGNWKEPAARAVQDRKPAQIAEFVRKRCEIVEPWRASVLQALERENADAKTRETALLEILQVDPDDAVVHGLRGELRVDDAWVLSETLLGKSRRAELRQWIDDARRTAVQPQVLSATSDDLALLPAWKLVLGSEKTRALLQTDETEARDILQSEHVARELVSRLCGKEVGPWPGFTAYVLVEPAEREKFVAAIPGASDDERKLWRNAVGFGIPGTASVVLWDKDRQRRLDCYVRHLVASCIYKSYGIDHRQGWVVDGLGIYLTREIVGTRFTWFTPSKASDKGLLRGKLSSPKANWMAEAQALLKRDDAPKLALVLALDLDDMRAEDLLVSYAFAAYLVEGQGKALPGILERVGAGAAGADSVAAVVGTSVEEIEKRFARWIEERK